jgi:hypothetical protein
MEAPRDDPTSFKRFAERVRTHLFNISMIGESGHVDIIETLALKLQLTDRLAWNSGRGLDLEHRTINDFSRWLTARAIAYQNAYAIADAQQRPAPSATRNHNQPSYPSHHRPAQKKRRNARKFHGASSTQDQRESGSTEHKEKKPSKPTCFKCEGSHRLEDCTFFKDLPTSYLYPTSRIVLWLLSRPSRRYELHIQEGVWHRWM